MSVQKCKQCILIVAGIVGLYACAGPTDKTTQSVSLKTTATALGHNSLAEGKMALPLEYQQQPYWLMTSKQQGMVLTDGQGTILSQFKGNMDMLDWRDNINVNGKQLGLIATVDNESGAVLLLALDWQNKQLSLLSRLSNSNTAIETLCLYQMPEGHVALFTVNEQGTVKQQLVVDGNKQTLVQQAVRQFIGSPQAKSCAVDDQNAAFYLVEENTGVWRYSADAESELLRDLIAVTAPFGQLQGEVTSVSVLSDSSLLIATPEAHSLWHLAISPASAVQYVIENINAPKTARARFTPQGLLVGGIDDDTTQYWQTSLPIVASSLKTPSSNIDAVLMAQVETQPVDSLGDAADDPAIWINHYVPENSLILGTNKKQGMLVYDLQGKLKQQLNVGRVNNVDLRYGFQLNGQTIDIAAASNRTHQSISLFSINPQNGLLTQLSDIATDLNDVYGLCMYQHQNDYYVFVNDTDGHFEQYQLINEGKHISGRKVREFTIGSQPEGCVADDKSAQLYFGEEAVGIWQVSALPTKSLPKLIAPLNDTFVADVEGMGIYHLNNHAFLVASSQGNNSYAVFALNQNSRYLGSFNIAMNIHLGIDGVSETDGLEVLNTPLGSQFPQGLLVVQDGRNVMPSAAQNFKLVNGTQLYTLIESWLAQ